MSRTGAPPKSDGRTPERQALADAIARTAAREADRRKINEAKRHAQETRWSARAAVDKAQAALASRDGTIILR